jgi:hypothetical protein
MESEDQIHKICRTVSPDRQTLVDKNQASLNPHITGWLRDVEASTNQLDPKSREILTYTGLKKDFSFITSNKRRNKLRLVEGAPKPPLEPLPSLGYYMRVKDHQKQTISTHASNENDLNLQKEDSESASRSQKGSPDIEVATKASQPLLTRFWISGNGPLTLQCLREALFVHRIKTRLKNNGQWDVVCPVQREKPGREEPGRKEAGDIQMLKIDRGNQGLSSGESISVVSQSKGDPPDSAYEAESSFRGIAGTPIISCQPEPLDEPVADLRSTTIDHGRITGTTDTEVLENLHLGPASGPLGLNWPDRADSNNDEETIQGGSQYDLPKQHSPTVYCGDDILISASSPSNQGFPWQLESPAISYSARLGSQISDHEDQLGPNKRGGGSPARNVDYETERYAPDLTHLRQLPPKSCSASEKSLDPLETQIRHSTLIEGLNTKIVQNRICNPEISASRLESGSFVTPSGGEMGDEIANQTSPLSAFENITTEDTELNDDSDEEEIITLRSLSPMTFTMYPIRLVVRAFLTTISNALRLLLNEHFPAETIPRDHVRIHWTCVGQFGFQYVNIISDYVLQKCGKKMIDDFIEKQPGAAQQLEARLNRPRQHVTGGDNESGSSPSSSKLSLSSKQPLSTQATSDESSDISNAKPLDNQSRYIPRCAASPRSNSADRGSLTQQLWLLACAEEQKYTTKLVHLDMDPLKIRSDMELSLVLKKLHSKMRQKWCQAMRLRGLVTIQFVQVSIHLGIH